MPNCTWCGKPAALETKHREDLFRRTGRAYCSTTCRDGWMSKDRSERMARTNRRYAAERMRRRNPMAREGAREKMRQSLRAMNWKPPLQGGNGRGPSVPQVRLARVLAWDMEVIVPTSMARYSGYPTHYNIDVGNAALKIAIEVDGPSHISRRELDEKKDEFLRGRGWIVLMFTNQEVMERLADCVQTVTSITSRLSTPTRTSPAA